MLNKKDSELPANNRLIAEVQWSFNEKLVNNLIKNHKIALINNKAINRTIEEALIKENNQLIQQILSLPIKEIDSNISDLIRSWSPI